MRHRERPLVLLLAVAFAGPAARPSGPAVREGIWSGGFGVLEGERPRWHSIAAELQGERLTGTLRLAFDERPLRGRVRDGRLAFQARTGGGVARCEARPQGGALLGHCRGADGLLSLRLVWEGTLEPESLRERTGLFVTGSGKRLAVRKSRHLILHDFDAGGVRALYHQEGDRFGAGPAFAVPHPVETTVNFRRDGDGEVVGLELTGPEGRRTAVRQDPLRVEELRFESDGVELAGDLHVPPGPGPHPALVWVHGSGRQTRTGAGAWPYYFTDLGFALLSVDKRGVGDSGGRYELADGSHDNLRHMRRRAGDVRAAVRALAARPGIEVAQIGLVGGSQAGWIHPMVARHGEVAFTITLSGGATTLSLEGLYSAWANESGSGGEPVEAVIERLRGIEPRDHDFRPEFRSQKAPGLWLYGGLDRSNPSQLCVELLREVARETGNDFTVRLFPEGNHGLWVARTGGAAESGTLRRTVPGLYRTIEGWLRERGFGRPGASGSSRRGTDPQPDRAVEAPPRQLDGR